jgi:hypothetical protein
MAAAGNPALLAGDASNHKKLFLPVDLSRPKRLQDIDQPNGPTGRSSGDERLPKLVRHPNMREENHEQSIRQHWT